MIDRQLIEKKLRNIEAFLRELKSIDIEGFEQFRKDTVIKRFVERNIELSIEQMVDICKHMISGLDLSEPETYAECFDILASNDIIPSEKSELFKSMVRYRNMLIHIYDTVDDSVTYDIYTTRLGDFKVFIDTVRGYLLGQK